MDLVVLEGYVVLVNGVPLLDAYLVGAGAGLGGDELLEVSDSVVVVALDAHLLSQTIVEHNFDHGR